jgi:hypothetical protein
LFGASDYNFEEGGIEPRIGAATAIFFRSWVTGPGSDGISPKVTIGGKVVVISERCGRNVLAARQTRWSAVDCRRYAA